jgi:hypothetical protein
MPDENKPKRITQTPEYLGGFLDALKQERDAQARAAEPESQTTWTDARGTIWTASKDTGIPITVTQPDDPAYMLLKDGHTSTPKVYRSGCYICEDPEFAQMGLPLCHPCPACQEAGRGDGHIAADDIVCDDCGFDSQAAYEEEEANRQALERGENPENLEGDRQA